MLKIGFAGAFLGGVLSLLSPCSALLLPAFFAYAFGSRRQLFLHTLIFFAGLATLFVPLGLGVGFIAQWVTVNRQALIQVAGGLLILLGVLELAGVGVVGGRLTGWLNRGRPGPGSPLSTYSLGFVYGIAGVCSGPLLGAVLTMAAASGTPLGGAGLLLTYALGMAAPLFFLAALWERLRIAERPWLQGRWTRLISGLLFISLGGVLIATGGTVALERYYADWGMLNWSFQMQTQLRSVDRTIPTLVALPLVVSGILALWVWSRRRQTR